MKSSLKWKTTGILLQILGNLKCSHLSELLIRKNKILQTKSRAGYTLKLKTYIGKYRQ